MIYYVPGRKTRGTIMYIKSIIEAIKCYEGTVKEMQLRFLLHKMREAADNGHTDVCIPKYKISKLHMATLRHEVLEPSGFYSKECEPKEIPGQKMLYISWN